MWTATSLFRGNWTFYKVSLSHRCRRFCHIIFAKPKQISLHCTLWFGWSGPGHCFLLCSLNISIPSEQITSEGASLVVGILISEEKWFPSYPGLAVFTLQGREILVFEPPDSRDITQITLHDESKAGLQCLPRYVTY